MGIKELVEQRARIETVTIKGGTRVRVMRLNRDEVLAVPSGEMAAAEQIVRTILKDESDEPFYANITEACRDGVLYLELLKASNKVNGLDIDEAEKNKSLAHADGGVGSRPQVRHERGRGLESWA